MPDFANHGTAAGLDDLGEIVGHLMTKSVVGNQQEPALAALSNDGTGCADRLRIRIERPVKARRRAILIGEPRCRRPGEQSDLPLLLGDLLHCQCNSRIRQLGNRTHPVDVKPTSRDGRGHVRFVLMIADDDLDRFSEDLAADILYSHARGVDRGLASKICVRPGLVVENPDAYDAAGALCIRDAIEK
jgi:hypothetical protein